MKVKEYIDNYLYIKNNIIETNRDKTDNGITGVKDDCLDKIVIQDRINYIKDYAYVDLNIEEVTILGNDLVSIGHSSFLNCDNLRKIVLPESVKYIHSCAFSVCLNLEEAILPYSLKFLGERSFSQCRSLKYINIPKVEYIRDSAFSYCDELEEVIIAEGTLKIGHYAFSNCPKLKNVIIPNSVVEIMEDSFCDCPKLNRKSIKRISGIL